MRQFFYEPPKVAAKSETTVNADFNDGASKEVQGLLAGGSHLRTKALEANVHFRGLISVFHTPRGVIKTRRCCCRGATVLVTKQAGRLGSCFWNGLDGSGCMCPQTSALMAVISRKVVRGAELQPAHPGGLLRTAWEF